MAAPHVLHTGETSPEVVVVLLAAGAGSRFLGAEHKLVTPIANARTHDPGRSDVDARTAGESGDDTTVLSQSLRHVLSSEIGPIVVVTGALAEVELRRRADIAALLDEPSVSVRHNARWAEGQATSVRAGVDAARQLGASAVVVGLGDQPMVTADAWRAVAHGLGPIVVATYDGRRGNPVKLHADVWGMLPASGDEGARVLMRDRPELVGEVPCTGSPADIDTVEDLHRWQNN